jgi:hypothetical protein
MFGLWQLKLLDRLKLPRLQDKRMMDNLQLTLPVLECSLRVLAFESTSERA